MAAPLNAGRLCFAFILLTLISALAQDLRPQSIKIEGSNYPLAFQNETRQGNRIVASLQGTNGSVGRALFVENPDKLMATVYLNSGNNYLLSITRLATNISKLPAEPSGVGGCQVPVPGPLQATVARAMAADGASPVATATNPATADILIVYTQAAANAVGGVSNLMDKAIMAVAEANQVYVDSKVYINLNLLAVLKVNFTESGDMGNDLNSLATAKSGLSEVATWREQYKADLVCMFVNEQSSPYAGIAYILTQGSDIGFSVVQATYAVGYYTFVHELGHNMGCQHDRATDNSGGFYSYSHGYKWTGGDNNLYRSVMAYSPGIRVGMFSTPEVSHMGTIAGTATENNARSLNERAWAIAGLRTAVSYTLTINRNGSGQVLCNGTDAPASLSVPGGEVVTLQGQGSFQCWSGDVNSTDSNIVIPVTSDMTVTANFSDGTSLAPQFTLEPKSQSVPIGDRVQLTAAGFGNPAPTFQWNFNGSPIPGAVTANHTIISLSATNAGNYSVKISNTSGSITSSNAVVTIGAAHFPWIVEQPAATNIVPKGSSVTLHVLASGGNLAYQWKKGATVIAGATSDTLTLNNVALVDSGNYTVTITNALNKVTSRSSVLTVVAPPLISSQPKKQNLLFGQNLYLSVTASGTKPYNSLSYRWTRDGSSIPGGTNSSLLCTNVSSAHSGNYIVIITNFGGSVTSAAALVTASADAAPPVLSVTLPSKPLTNANYVLVGTARDNVAISNITYTVDGGLNGTNAAGTNNWAKWGAPLDLKVGTNVIGVTAHDVNGNTSTNWIKLVYAPFFDAALTVVGKGSVSGWPISNKAQWGAVYSLVPKPEQRHLFVSWSALSGMSVLSNSTALKFTVTNTVAATATFFTNNFFDAAGEYNGLFYETNAIAHATAGFVKLNITTNLFYSGKVLIAGKTIPIAGQVDLDGVASASLGSGTSLSFSMAASQLTGTVISGVATSLLTANLAVFGKTKPATDFAGSYTLVIPPGADGASHGFGYGYATVTTNGEVALTGAVADGAVLAQSVRLSKGGVWPLFAPLYQTRTNYNGELIGWLSLATNGFATGAGPGGQVFWVKTNTAGAVTNCVDILGSPYKIPTKSKPKALPDLVWGTIWFMGGDLTNDVGAWMFAAKNGSAYAYDPATTIQFLSTGGRVTGKFLHNATGRQTTYYGTVLQNMTNAFGFFVGPNSAGSMQMDAVPTSTLAR